MGWALYRMGRLEEAEKYLSRAFFEGPDPEIAAHLGEVLWVVADGERETGFRVWHPNNVWWRFEPHRFTDTETYRALSEAGFTITDQEFVNRLQLIELEPAQTQ